MPVRYQSGDSSPHSKQTGPLFYPQMTLITQTKIGKICVHL
jgi:hypothetical protein